MKKIHFDSIRKNWFLIILLVLSIICILVGLLGIFQSENYQVNRKILAIGLLLQAIFFSRMFWYRNYVQYNGKGIVIRIKSFFGKTLRFDEIKSIDLKENLLTITKNNGNIVSFDLNGIVESDIQKLVRIFRRHIV